MLSIDFIVRNDLNICNIIVYVYDPIEKLLEIDHIKQILKEVDIIILFCCYKKFCLFRK